MDQEAQRKVLKAINIIMSMTLLAIFAIGSYKYRIIINEHLNAYLKIFAVALAILTVGAFLMLGFALNLNRSFNKKHLINYFIDSLLTALALIGLAELDDFNLSNYVLIVIIIEFCIYMFINNYPYLKKLIHFIKNNVKKRNNS